MHLSDDVKRKNHHQTLPPPPPGLEGWIKKMLAPRRKLEIARSHGTLLWGSYDRSRLTERSLAAARQSFGQVRTRIDSTSSISRGACSSHDTNCRASAGPFRMAFLILLLLLRALVAASDDFAANASVAFALNSTLPFLSAFFPPDCPVGFRCLSFATPYFGRWAPVRNGSFSWCPRERRCAIVSDHVAAHALVFHGANMAPFRLFRLPRPPMQRWVYFSGEAPANLARREFDIFADKGWRFAFHWTATYHRGADVRIPYGETVALSPNSTPLPILVPLSARRKLALSIISNCDTVIHRLAFVRALQVALGADQLDLFGNCGTPLLQNVSVTDLAKDYVFYLAFENALCQDYITEKFWWNSLHAGLIPVVVGGLDASDYLRVAPPGSYLLVSASSTAADVAARLRAVARDPNQYAALLTWRRHFQVRNYERRFVDIAMCRLCAQLHNEDLSDPPVAVDLFAAWNISQCSQRVLAENEDLPPSNLGPDAERLRPRRPPLWVRYALTLVTLNMALLCLYTGRHRLFTRSALRTFVAIRRALVMSVQRLWRQRGHKMSEV